MSGPDTWITASLIFMRYKRISMNETYRLARQSLEALGQVVTTSEPISETQALIKTETSLLRFSMREDVNVPTVHPRADVVLRVELQTIASEATTSDAGIQPDSVLACLVLNLHNHFQPAHVQWIEDEAVLSASEFAMATSLAEPPLCTATEASARPCRLSRALPEIETLHAQLDCKIERLPPPAPPKVKLPFDEIEGALDGIIEDLPEFKQVKIENIRDDNDILRLSAWFLSIAVACFVLPVGLTLMILNLVKGENVRLASQTAAISGLFFSLQTNGATAQALIAVETVLTN